MARQSYKSIRKQIEKLEVQAAKLEAVADEKKKKAVAKIVSLMKKLNVTPEDIVEHRPRRGRRASKKTTGAARPRKPVAPKFRNTKTGETWSGRGRTPRWLAALESQGKSRESYRIQ